MLFLGGESFSVSYSIIEFFVARISPDELGAAPHRQGQDVVKSVNVKVDALQLFDRRSETRFVV